MDYQVLAKEMNEAGKLEHSTYKGVREKDVKLMSPDELKAKRRADNEAVALYKKAHESYLKRTGQTNLDLEIVIEETRKILE